MEAQRKPDERYNEPVNSELRASATWRYCAEELVTRAGMGALGGAATAFLIFRGGRSLARGTVVGLWTGFGAGSAYELCNERFRAFPNSITDARKLPAE